MKPERLRARAIAEWRGLPETFERPDRAVACGVAVQKLMKELGLAPEPTQALQPAGKEGDDAE